MKDVKMLGGLPRYTLYRRISWRMGRMDSLDVPTRYLTRTIARTHDFGIVSPG